MGGLERARELQRLAARIDEETPLLKLLETLGTPHHTGSVVHSLMVKPDLDFEVQTKTPDFERALALVPKLVSELGASVVKVTNFENDKDESAHYFVGCDFTFEGLTWHVDATVTAPGLLDTSTLELLKPASDEQKETILKLKSELINARRYLGGQSQPPYTFRSVHVYEGVMKGGASTIDDLENYFKAK